MSLSSRRSPVRTAPAPLVLVLCGALLMTACGTRVSDDEVLRAAGGVAAGSADATADLGVAATGPDQAASGGPGLPSGSETVTSGTAGSATAPSGGTGSTGSTVTSSGGTGGTGGGSGDAGATGGAGSTGCTKAGPPIVLGQVVSASGIIGANVGSALPTLQAWAKAMNAAGGIACHPVTVLGRDDASDPGKASAAVQDLVQNKKAVALVGAFVPLSINGFRSAVDKEKVPVIGGDLFSTTWWEDPLFYPVGTFVDANAFGSSQALSAAGAKKVAVIYCIEAGVCPPYKDAVVKNAGKGGYSVVYQKQVSITQPSFTSECQSAKDAGATQINMIIEGGAVGRFANSCAQIGYFPKFAVASLGATFDPSNANVRKITVTIASAANDWFTATTPGQAEFQAAMKRYAPSLKLDPTSVLAWADGMMVKAAIERLGPSARDVPITTELFFKGLSMVKGETLKGLIPANDFSPSRGPNPKNNCYFTMQFKPDGKWDRLSEGCLK